MNLKKFNFGFLSALAIAFVLVSCSKDNGITQESANDIQTLSNGDISLSYGEGLNKYVSIKNVNIPILNRPGNGNTVLSAPTNNFQQPDLTGANALMGSGFVAVNQPGAVYYIPQGETFTGTFFMNQAATLYVFGVWDGNAGAIPGNGLVVVAPSGVIKAHNLSFNNSSELDNYGTVHYYAGNINGVINNYHHMTFSQANLVTINQSAVVNNYCQLDFTKKVIINNDLSNYGQVTFENGFQINTQGNLILAAGTLAEMTGGSLNLNGKISNPDNAYARMNIKAPASVGIINWGAKVDGKIDLNFDSGIDYSALQTPSNPKLINGATINGNVHIAGNACIQSQGAPASSCDPSAINLTLVAQVGSPIMIGGSILSATDTRIENGLAYVSYHTNDQFYDHSPNGALRIFNLHYLTNPSILQQAVFHNAEFNGVDVHDGWIYAVGGNKDGGRLIASPLSDDGEFSTSTLSAFEAHKVPSLTAKNSYIHNNRLWLASGSTGGGLFELDPTSAYQVVNQYNPNGARAKYVVQNGTYQVFFSLDENGVYLRIANVDGTNPQTYSYAIKPAIINGKDVIAIDDSYAYVSLSDKGVAKIDLSNGDLVKQFVPSEYMANGHHVFDQGGYTNGLALSDCYLFLANGADGVIILNKNTFDVVGSFNLPESSNYVYIKDHIMFVATGRDGLNIIKMN